MGDWSLIARYLRKEASCDDLKQFDALLGRHPNLRMELDWLTREVNTPRSNPSVSFNSEQAWERLSQRFENEGLI